MTDICKACEYKGRVYYECADCKYGNKTSYFTPKQAGCKCIVKRTEISGMGIIYARSSCPIHGHLHGARVEATAVKNEPVRMCLNCAHDLLGFKETPCHYCDKDNSEWVPQTEATK